MACKCAKSIESIEDRIQVAFKNATAVAHATAEKVEDIEPFTQGPSYDKDQLKNPHYQSQRTTFLTIKSWKGNFGEMFKTAIVTPAVNVDSISEQLKTTCLS